MTIGELIDHLKGFDPELYFMVSARCYSGTPEPQDIRIRVIDGSNLVMIEIPGSHTQEWDRFTK